MASPSPSSRCAYAVGFKLEVAKFAEGHGNRAAARHFAVSEANVRRWREQKRMGSFKATPRTAKKLGSGRKAFFPELENALFEWVVAGHKAGGGALTTGAIAAKGRELAQRKGLVGFTGRPSWVHRFMRRKGLAVGRRAGAATARRLPDAYDEKIYEFHRRIYKMRKKEDYALADIVGMDETPVWLEMPCGDAAVDAFGVQSVSTVGTGGEKLRFSVMLSCCADGRKLEPMCIFKRKTVPKDAPCGGVAVTVQQQGYCDEQVMKEWISRCLMRRPNGGGLLRRRSLLVMDMFSAHVHESVREWLEEERVSVAIIPGGLGRVLQPVEIAVNGPFKESVRDKWAAWMRRENPAVTASGKVKRAGVPEVCAFVKEAWDEISSEVIVKGFLKAGISNALDGSQDEELFSEPGDGDDSSWNDEDSSGEEECDGFCTETETPRPLTPMWMGERKQDAP
uniref:Pogo transposable element with KRAB domain n=1 Tax=Petromyzon marinus TaxID=7757 RepID=A0AAJ7TT47_PETMA|nr:pogo transposable element with KRAB domain [Petromyzon marinus]